MSDSSRSEASRRFGEQDARPGTPGFGRLGTLLGGVIILALIGGLLWSALGGNATAATHPNLLSGSIVLSDYEQLPVLDRATGDVTVQLQNVYEQVGASTYQYVQPVPVDGGTMLVNSRTGAFNLLQADNYVADPKGSGIGLGALAGSTAATGYPAGSAAYIVRQAPKSTVSLVNGATVTEAASNASASTGAGGVTPLGFASLDGTVPGHPGATLSGAGGLWTLVKSAAGACSLQRVSRTARGSGLVARSVTSVPDCADAAVGSAGSTIGLATPGRVVVYRGGRTAGTVVNLPATASATTLLPVTGGSGTLWFLAGSSSGWSLFGVGPGGGVVGHHVLAGVPTAAEVAQPVISDGKIYTLGQNFKGQPPLWVIDPSSGKVANLEGVPGGVYPRVDKKEEGESFSGAQVVVSGPRVVYNNPASIEAVVVFTDGSRAPLIVNKSTGVAVAATGPATLATTGKGGGKGTGTKSTGTNSKTGSRGRSGTSRSPTTVPNEKSSPNAVSSNVNCADTTEKPYVPTGVNVTPADESAQVTWSYTLLTSADCEPRTWSVKVTAIDGGQQPSNPVQYINGQSALDVTGLRPSTHYIAVVTAYINKQSTSSEAVGFATSAQGADAPGSVSARVDQNGDWVVSWTKCDASKCYTPASTWVVTGSACGGSYAGSPVTDSVSGNTYSATINAAAMSRLGQSLTFSVQGISAQGLRGNSTSGGGCLQSWRAPTRGLISLAAAGTVSGNQSVTATLDITPTAPNPETYGSNNTEFEYFLNSQPYKGPTTATSVTITGLSPNTKYKPTVEIWPAGHQSASVTVSAPAIKQDLSWPAALAATTNVVLASGAPNVGEVNITVTGLPSSGGPYTISGSMTCGSSTIDFNGTPISGEGVAELSKTVNLVTTQSCSGPTFTVTSTASPNPFGVASPQVNSTLNSFPTSIPTYQDNVFKFSYTQTGCVGVGTGCTTVIQVTALGSDAPYAGGNWLISAYQPEDLVSAGCSNSVDMEPPQMATVTLTGCPLAQGIVHSTPVVDLKWEYLGQPQELTVGNSSGTSGTTTTTTSTTSTSTTSTSTTSTSTTTTTVPGGGSTTSVTGGDSTTSTAVGTSARKAIAALAAAHSDPGPPTNRAATLLFDLLVATTIAAAIALGLVSRFRRRRNPFLKGSA